MQNTTRNGMQVQKEHADDVSSSSRFKWKIENISKLNEESRFSPVYEIGPHKWRLLVFHRGCDVNGYLSVYVDAVGCMNWRFAKFSVAVVDQINNRNTLKQDTENMFRFTEDESDWGFDEFIPLKELKDPSNGYIANDACIVEVEFCLDSIQDFKEVGKTVMNLELELARVSKLKCCSCGLKGAALGCFKRSCRNTYHVPCAFDTSGCRWDDEGYLLLCPSHSGAKFSSEKTKKGKRLVRDNSSAIQSMEHLLGQEAGKPTQNNLKRKQQASTDQNKRKKNKMNVEGNPQTKATQLKEKSPEAEGPQQEKRQPDHNKRKKNKMNEKGCQEEAANNTTASFSGRSSEQAQSSSTQAITEEIRKASRKQKRRRSKKNKEDGDQLDRERVGSPPSSELSREDTERQPRNFHEDVDQGIESCKMPTTDRLLPCPETLCSPSHVHGGPRSADLLVGYKYHIANAIWKEKDPLGGIRFLKIDYHGQLLKKWIYKDESEPFRKIIERSGFVPFIETADCVIDKPLANAFSERFHPETGTFHLPFGEMTVTLPDVHHVLNFNVDGEIPGGCMKTKLTERETIDLCRETLGLSEEVIVKEFRRMKIKVLYSLSYKFLRNTFSCIHTKYIPCPPEKFQQAARAYLLYSSGAIMFGDKSGASVPVHYLQCFKDIHSINKYSWAKASLASLYGNLTKGSRVRSSQMGGDLRLLQAWIYNYFPSLRRNVTIEEDRYERSNPRDEHHNPTLLSLREKIDDLVKEEVVWNPYGAELSLQPCMLYTGYTTFFKHGPQVYRPDRVVRQFGFVQNIPEEILYENPESTTNKDSGSKLKVLSSLIRFTPKIPMDVALKSWNEREISCLDVSQFTKVRKKNESEAVPEYLSWFNDHCHPYVANPIQRTTDKAIVSQFASTLNLVAMRKKVLADEIDSLTNDQNFDAVKAKLVEICLNLDNPTVESG